MKIGLITLFFSLLLHVNVYADDLGVSVLGGESEDVLSNSKVKGESPYLESSDDSVENIKSNHKSSLLPDLDQDEVKSPNKKSEYTNSGITVPGTFENQENYIDIDKHGYSKDIRTHSTMGVNLTYIRDNFTYTSPNDVIARTISTGYKHVQSGFLLMRVDNYFYRSSFVNLHWSMGGGIAYNSGKGVFVSTGEQSDARFTLWEIPLDAGVGLEIPVTKWLKLTATGGPSVLTLIQNRNDLTEHETGKNKAQFGLGGFGSMQFKINMMGLTGESAYEMHTSSQISNLFLNLEARYQTYEKYLDAIKISGMSYGAGVTFEFL